jgi:hypothetical protein
MMTLFGTFEPREEHLLLTMFDHALEAEFGCAKDLGRYAATVNLGARVTGGLTQYPQAPGCEGAHTPPSHST